MKQFLWCLFKVHDWKIICSQFDGGVTEPIKTHVLSVCDTCNEVKTTSIIGEWDFTTPGKILYPSSGKYEHL